MVLNESLIKKGTYFVDVKDFGAVGDGIHDDTNAFQSAIDTRKPVLISEPSNEFKITDSLIVYSGTILVDCLGGPNYYSDARVKLNYQPGIKKDMFILGEEGSNDYFYGVTIGVFSVTGTNGKHLFNLPKMSNLYLFDIKQFGGFDYAMVIDGYIDTNIDRCSFQGTIIASVHIIVSYHLSTTTTFNKCYFSHGDKGIIVEEGAINLLVFYNCVFESLNMLGDFSPENNITFTVKIFPEPIQDTLSI